ncbi:hypothetical protein ACLIKD_06430 [Azonexus sp. IMCC34842]|uniref:hypothetical protein n=1 Tax=Azonexus sp. IMCC34842 TaxID=3420950 RepID=UPI003D115A0B
MKSVLALLVATSALSGYPPAYAEDFTDTRQVVNLLPAERVWMLGEMRTNLSTISAILTALSGGNAEQARNAALDRGTVRLNDPERKKISEKAPDGWKPLSKNIHQGFDSIAKSIGAGAPQSQTLSQLGSLMQNCVACHAAYRVSEND